MHANNREIDVLRPNIESLVVDREDTEDCLFQWPFASIVTQDELIVLQIIWQRIITDQFALHFLAHFLPTCFHAFSAISLNWVNLLKYNRRNHCRFLRGHPLCKISNNDSYLRYRNKDKCAKT